MDQDERCRPGPDVEFRKRLAEQERKRDEEEFKRQAKHYKLSLLIFEILEEVNQHQKSWEICNKLIADYEEDVEEEFMKF